MDERGKRSFLLNAAFYGAAAGAAYLALRVLLGPLLPFAAGFAVAAALRPAAEELAARLGIRRAAAAGAVTALLYIALGTLAAGALWLAVMKLCDALEGFPAFLDGTLLPAAERACLWVEETLGGLSPRAAGRLSAVSEGLFSSLGQAAAGAVDVSSAVAALPGMFAAALFTVLSSLFIGADYRNVTGFLLRQVPEGRRELLHRAKKNILGTLSKMFVSYLMLTAVTFCELLAALWLLRVEDPAGAALISAAADLLPVVGVGVVLAPWVLAELIMGNWPLAAGLAAAWGIVSVVRGWLEPKVVGRRAGLHPLAALAAVYAGGALFGAVGAVALPVLLAAARALQDEGAVRLWKQPSL